MWGKKEDGEKEEGGRWPEIQTGKDEDGGAVWNGGE